MLVQHHGISPALGQSPVLPHYNCSANSRYWVTVDIGSMTDRQTDILLTEIKVITDLFVIVIREIYVHVYTRMLVC